MSLRRTGPHTAAAATKGAAVAACEGAAQERTDRRFFWVLTGVLVLVAALPVLLGWLHTPVGYEYTGFMAGREDYYTYLAKMRLGWEGGWLFVNRYSLEGHSPVFIFGFYLLLGHICRWLSLPLWAGYHLSRLILLPFALQAFWAFLGTQLRSAAQRRQAFILGFFLSSFFLFAGDTSGLLRIETHMTEHFYLALLYPHYLVDGIALAWSLVAFLRWLDHPAWRHLLVTVACLWTVALVHPFMALPVLAVPGLYGLLFRRDVLWRAWAYLFGAGLSALPLMGYMAWALYGDPVLAQWRSQATSHFPLPWLEPFWFGLGLPLAALGAWFSLRHGQGRAAGDKVPAAALSLTWVLVVLVLINLPLIQNRWEFALFMSVPVAALVTVGLAPVQQWLVTRPRVLRIAYRSALPFALCFSGMIAALVTLAGNISPAADSLLLTQRYLSAGYLAGMDYLAAHAEQSSVLIAPFTASNQAPAFSPVRVYAGHPVETLTFRTKEERSNAFYKGELPPELARGFLRQAGATYVLEDRFSNYDFANLKVTGDLTPPLSGLQRYQPAGFLQRVFTNADVTIYKVAL